MADHKKVIGLMEATGVEIGRLQAWSEMFARSENHNLVAVATGLQYLVLVNTDDRTECFRDNGFSPVARDVYDWMVREKKVDYACLAAHGFVIIEEEACATDGEETLSIVNMRKANAAAMPAIDIEFMRTVDYRIGPECMANLRPKEPECVQLTEHLTFREAQSVVEYAVQEVVSGGRAEEIDPDVENLKWFVADDVIESFRNAKGLPALGMTHSVSLISMGHYLTKHCGGADIPVGTHGYCYLDGFKYEMQQPVFINSGELPLLMMVIPWYALAVRYGLAIPVNVTTGGDVCHFSVDDAGDVFGSLKRMLALVAETKHIRVGFITSSFVPGYVREHTVRTLVPRCECGVQAESLIPADVSDTADAETGHVLVAWLAKPLLGCKYQLTTPGVYNVNLHAGRLTVETGVAIVTVPRRMCVTLNGGAMVDTRDTFGSVRLLCIGGFEFVTDNVLDHADVQIVVGSKSDFQAWFSAYVDDTPHFPGLVNERGIGVYAWSETTRTKSRPVAIWSKVIGTEAVVLLTGGLRVGFPFNLRLCLSSYVDVVRPELGTIRKENMPVCYKSYDLDEFPYYTGVAFSQWLHSQMGGDDCNMCFGVRKGL